MAENEFVSKTYSPDDLKASAGARLARELRRFAVRLALTGTPFAVNGVLRRRFFVRRHKLWEYARGLACILGSGQEPAGKRVLDFGGGATLPVYFLAHRGCEVLSLDTDHALNEAANRAANERGWRLRGSTHDLTRDPEPSEWGQFDAVISFSVLEHIPKEHHPLLLKRLASLLKPGGIMAITFDYSADAPMPYAIRSEAEVSQLVVATGLDFVGGGSFVDTGERFALDKRHPENRFTFGSLFLRRPDEEVS